MYGIGALKNDTIVCPYNGEPTVQHPTVKPLQLMKALIVLMTNGTVLDPFMGSGTTLVAAKDMRQCAVGIEREERYCEIAARRLAQEVMQFGA